MVSVISECSHRRLEDIQVVSIESVVPFPRTADSNTLIMLGNMKKWKNIVTAKGNGHFDNEVRLQRQVSRVLFIYHEGLQERGRPLAEGARCESGKNCKILCAKLAVFTQEQPDYVGVKVGCPCESKHNRIIESVSSVIDTFVSSTGNIITLDHMKKLKKKWRNSSPNGCTGCGAQCPCSGTSRLYRLHR